MARTTAKRVERLNDLVETINSSLDKRTLRYEVLNQLASRHGVSYETIKSDMYTLAYALLEGPEYGVIPKKYRNDVKRIKELVENGTINREKARRAAEVFIEHTPRIDKERITLVHGIKGKEVEKLVDEIGRYLEEIAKTRRRRWPSHPARAYAYAWNRMGRKIHQELENARDITERLMLIANKLNENKRLSQSESRFLDAIGIKPNEVFRYVDPNRTMEENLKSMYLRVLEHNRDYAQAIWHYEQAVAQHISMYRQLKSKWGLDVFGKAPSAGIGSIRWTGELKVGDMIESNYKNIRRWNVKPGSKAVGFSRRYKNFVKNIGEVRDVHPLEDPWLVLKRHASIIGYHLKNGDEIYARIKEREREDKVLKAIVKWRPRRGRR